jgi:hypothetical protein
VTRPHPRHAATAIRVGSLADIDVLCAIDSDAATLFAVAGFDVKRAGFVVVPERECHPEILRELAYQRRWLPCPEQRVSMRKDRFRDTRKRNCT